MPELTKIQTGFLEPQDSLKLSSGTQSAPGIHFDGDENTGLYRSAEDEIGVSIAGSEKYKFTSEGLKFNGTSLEGTPYFGKIDKDISSTAVDIFIYDTSRDSDGGAWRKRTQDKSWYNETLNTTTRGSREEFPAVAIIVLERQRITIYDGDDPDLPMWMVFEINQYTNSGNLAFTPVGIGHVASSPMNSVSLSSVYMMNGHLAVGGNRETNSSSVLAAYEINFLSEIMHEYLHYPVSASKTTKWKLTGNVSQRNSTAVINSPNSRYSANPAPDSILSIVHDVAMVVLPNAPIDPITGIQTPTVAFAGELGLSINKDDGSVINYLASNAAWHPLLVEPYGKDKFIVALDGTAGGYIVSSFHSDGGFNITDNPTSNNWLHFRSNGGNAQIYIASEYPSAGINFSGLTEKGVSTDQGINFFSVNESNYFNSLNATASTSHNTGWMLKNTSAYINGNNTTSVSGSELVTNGTFNSDTAGWTDIDSSWSIITGGVSSTTADDYLDQQLTTVIGEQYLVSFDINNNYSNTQNGVYIRKGDASSYIDMRINNETGSFNFTFTAIETNHIIRLYSGGTGTISYDNVSVRLAEPDKSPNSWIHSRSNTSNGLALYGTPTRNLVATGSDLVSYTGWNSTKYLHSPPMKNHQFSFGTGDFSIIFWHKCTSTTPDRMWFTIGKYSSADSIHVLLHNSGGDGDEAIFSCGGDTISTDTEDGAWHNWCFNRSGGRLYLYKDAKLINSITSVRNIIGPDDHGVYIGTGFDGSVYGYGANDLCLFRLSSSSPTPEQVEKIYRNEKVLFQENAKCTLYGSSNAVTALAYDEITDELHAGTTDGKSVFSGLRRINNTTTGVTTAISAHDGNVLQQ